MNTRNTLKINEKGHLEIGGADCVDLAARFSTPLYVLDEAQIRAMMSVFRDTLAREYGDGQILYASKALCCEAMYAIAAGEGLGADVVSGGELYTALRAGFPAKNIYFHGNNKLPHEISEALDAGVGCIVLDSETEAELVAREASRRNIVQKVLIRINPGVEAHTHAYIQTANSDSKFGFSVAGGAAERMARLVLSLPALSLAGFHCHIGSQIFERTSFAVAAEKCIAFLAEIKQKLGFSARELNLGGGIGIYYNEKDPKKSPADFADFLTEILRAVKRSCRAHGVENPRLLLEPGRAIVGEAGVTLYTVGAIKDTGTRKYLAVDGGMFDNPRYCLYGAEYEAVLAARADERAEEIVAIAGKCCESGDLIGKDFNLPCARVGDLVAVLSTGAYNYSMASHYNRNLIPPVVLVCGGEAEYIVRPETYEDLVSRDVLPDRLK